MKDNNVILEKDREHIQLRTAIALDFFGVLVPNKKLVAQQLAELYNVSSGAIQSEVFENKRYRDLQVGGSNESDLVALIEETVGKQLTIEDVVDYWRSEVPAPTPAAASFLDWCRLEFDLVFLVSDMHKVHYRCARQAGWLAWFDGVITSYKVKSLKFTGVPYQQCVKLIPEGGWQLVAVDDRQENLVAAHELGFYAICKEYDRSFAQLRASLKDWLKTFVKARGIEPLPSRSKQEDTDCNE